MKVEKKILYILFLSFVFAVTPRVYSQSGWFWQHPYPQGNSYNDIFFLNESTGLAVTGFEILRTTDGGLHWNANNIEPWLLNSIYFVDDQTGWGSFYNIYKTTNGGNNWILQFSPNNGHFNNLYFINYSTGLALGNDGIYKTTNGGDNWNKKLNNVNGELHSFSFVNNLLGWVCCSDSGKFYKTTNGGDNWIVQKSNYNVTINSVSFGDSLNGHAFGESGVYLKSTNGGTNWIQGVSFGLSSLRDCRFINKDTGWVGSSANGIAGNIWKTTNNGINWNVTDVSMGVSKIFLVSQSCLYICGGPGMMGKSLDGTNWTHLSYGLVDFLHTSFFINENTGWVAGGNADYTKNTNNTSYGVMLKTTNGGFNWNEYTNLSTTRVNSFSFLNENTGWAVGRNSFIVKTTNGGNNWSNLQAPAQMDYKDIHFINSESGWIAGFEGFNNISDIFYTTNNGVNWSSQLNTFRCEIKSFSFLNNMTGWACGGEASYQGKVFKTTNGGQNWDVKFEISGLNFKNVFFLNESTGWVGGQGGYLYKTINSGVNWFMQSHDTIGDIENVKFIDENIGWVVGARGLFKTTNGGQNWYSLYYKTYYPLYSINFVNQNTGWIVGGFGSILKTTNGGAVFANNIQPEIPSGYVLYQNYPNPFNPVTMIEYSLPKSGRVVIRVFDVTGREIRTVEDEFRQAGNYSVVFDGTGLASGVYFYRMKSGDAVRTRKMALVK